MQNICECIRSTYLCEMWAAAIYGSEIRTFFLQTFKCLSMPRVGYLCVHVCVDIHMTCLLYSMCTVCVQYVYSMCTVCVQYVYSMCTVCVQYVYSMCTVCVQYVYSMCTVCVQYV